MQDMLDPIKNSWDPFWTPNMCHVHQELPEKNEKTRKVKSRFEETNRGARGTTEITKQSDSVKPVKYAVQNDFSKRTIMFYSQIN
uniref:Uncharacterized protein n=1 Tax=Caenorhabditis tropicalis TaxID=1561998 RepID=A0A1I7UFT4_9PELO